MLALGARGAAGDRSVPGAGERRAGRGRLARFPASTSCPALIGALQGEVSGDLHLAPDRRQPAGARSGWRTAAWRSAWSARGPPGRHAGARQLMADELVVVVTADHPWAGRGSDHARRPPSRAHDRPGARLRLARGAGARARRASDSTSAPSGSSARWARRRRSSRRVRAGVGRLAHLQARGGGRVPGRAAGLRAR